jgi:hypothetical protein
MKEYCQWRADEKRGGPAGPGIIRRWNSAASTQAGEAVAHNGRSDNSPETAAYQKPMITAHRFRHTVGTELAEGGARLHTIMKMLGHTSTEMTLVYAHISDKPMAEDYQKVLGPGAELAGPLAEQLRAGVLPEESVEWLKTNFFKTELEPGHCLRLSH